MLIGQNSNLQSTNNGSILGVPIIQQNQKQTPLLLKPTGVPVFTPVGNFNTSTKDFQMTSQTSLIDAQSTLEATIGAREFEKTNQRTVKAKSFVIGKKVENQTGINLIDLENVTLPQEKQFPVKVLYVKPTHEKKQFLNHKEDKQEISKQQIKKINNENLDTLNRANLELLNKNTQPKELPIQKQQIKQNGVSDQNKLQEQKHRPKSATSQQIKKDSIKHSKLGPNTTVKPQISYVNKVATSQQQRPQSAKQISNTNNLLNQKDEKQPKVVPANRFEKRVPSPPKVDVEIPFTQNRFQGKFGDLTKNLIKKAQEALIEEKNKIILQKEEQELKKKKQKELADEVKQKNMELVKQQKEKGVERFDPRKREQELIEQKRKEEAKQEREKQKLLRRKRQEESKKQLGLDIFDEEVLKKHHNKLKEQQKQKEDLELKNRKLDQVKDHLKEQNQKREKPMILQLNRDLAGAYRQYQDQHQNNLDQQEIDKSKEIIDKKKLLEEQKRKKKQKQLEEKQKLEEERQRKEEQIKKLNEHTKKIREDIVKRQELEKIIQEEKEKLQVLENERLKQQQQKKMKKSKKAKANNHQEQLNDLRNWIDQQIEKAEQDDYNNSQSNSFINIPGKVQFQDGQNVNESMDNKMKVQIVKKSQITQSSQKQKSLNNSKIYDDSNIIMESQYELDNNSDMFTNEAITKPIKKVNKVKQMKYQLPGNSDIPYQDQLKYGVRQDRYGLFSDNGYGELIEIKKRKIEEVDTKKSNKNEKVSQEERNMDIKLSKDGMVQIINKISEYAKLKEQQLFKEQIEHPERFKNEQEIQDYDGNEQVKSHNIYQRQIVNIQQNQKTKASSTVPGVVNIEQEAKRLKDLQKQKEIDATMTIQKWSRGFLARQQVRGIRLEKQRDIEAEYGYFEDQVKFNTDYNLQKFLKEKQKLRTQNKTQRLHESHSIQERIGDSNSASISQSQHQKQTFVRGRSAPQTQYTQAPQVQNFFREKSDKDPLSLIEIFAKKNAPKIVPAVVKSPVKIDTHSQSQQLKRSHIKVIKASSSDIDEEIYTESFERDDEDQKSIKTASIDEDLIEGSKGMSSSSIKEQSHLQLQQRSQFVVQLHKKPFEYRHQSASLVEDSIQEDPMLMSMSKSYKSPYKKDNHNHDSSIAEESMLQQQMSVMSKNSNKRNSLMEDDIQEELEGSEEKIASARKFKIDVKKQENTKQMNEHQIQVAEFEKKMKADEEKRKNYVNEMLTEMKRYEQASVSTVVVERMEKIITQSLAQKDKILMGQRLHELELEKQHKDEINRIREEQIRLLSQLVLLGPNGAQGLAQTDEERKQILDNIQKIIDKPIVIQQQQQQLVQNIQNRKKPKITVESSSDKDDDVEYGSDFIEESKGLSQKQKQQYNSYKDDNDDSIQESINPSKDDDDSIITESIVEDIEDEVSHKNSNNDEIKDSIYVDGKKLQDKKPQNQKDDNNELQKIRYALGSEEALRKQSKNALKRSKNGGKIDEGSEHDQLKSSGIFEKHSFQEFTNQKFKQFLFDQDALNDVMKEFEKAIDEKRHEKEEKIKKKLIQKQISPRTFKKRNTDIEKWVSQERKDFMKKQQRFMQSMGEMGNFIKQLDMNKKNMLEQIGSPRQPLSSRSANIYSQSSMQELNDITESSDESIRVRQARDQLKKLTNDLNKDDPEHKAIIKKKKAAQKLIQEKEKAIEEGLKSKLKEIEQQQANKMLDLALNLDIQKEIDKRIHGARRAIEESSDNFNEYSARSYSQSMGPALSVSEDPKKKKNVKFASPAAERQYSSVNSQHSMSHSEDRSSKYKQSNRNAMDGSIEESIKIEESIYSISGDVSNKIIESSKRSYGPVSQGRNHTSNSNFQDSIKESIKESVKESIKESLQEDSQEYSDDFVQSYAGSDASKSLKLLDQQKNKLIQKANTIQSPPNKHQQSDQQFNDNVSGSKQSVDIDEDIGEYSMNFDESIGQSQQLQKIDQSMKQQQQKVIVDKVDEEDNEDDDDQNEQLKSQSSKVKDSHRDSSDVDEVDVVSDSVGASSKLIASHQEIADSAQDQLYEDKEIVVSSRSVEWLINLADKKQLNVKISDDEEDLYDEDFEKIEEDYEQEQDEEEQQQDLIQESLDKILDKKDNKFDEEEDIEEEESEEESDGEYNDLDDLKSFPDDKEESMDDYNDKVDRITDEFMELFLNEIKENEDLRLMDKDNMPDEDDFKDKFPFNIMPKEEEMKAPEPPKVTAIVNKSEEKKFGKKSAEEEMRQKYEEDLKKVNEQTKDIENYIQLIISNIDKQEFIDLLEKPIEQDPLQKLAFIYLMEDEHMNQNNSFIAQQNNQFNQQSILSFDFFTKIEQQYNNANNNNNNNISLDSEKQKEIQIAHHKAIFNAFNQALDIERPYKQKGQPAPWSKQTRIVRPRVTENEVDKILKKCVERVMAWCNTHAGTNLAPIPPAPPSSDPDNQQLQPPLQSDEERRTQAREEKLGMLMMKELEENESKWIDYENEDTQVKIDLADQILDCLSNELVEIMMGLRKF